MLQNQMHRQVLLLATAQALFQSTSVLVVTIGGLAGSQVAASPALATAPLGAMFLGNAFTTFPAAMWMARVGRRAGFIAGAALGIVGGLVCAAGVVMSSLLVLCLGTMFLGAYQAFSLYYRFAASEVSDEAFRPKAISFVMTGGIVAAFLGPALARWGEPLIDPQYTGSFLLVSAVSVIAMLLLPAVRVPAPPAAALGAVRPLAHIVRQPSYLIALFGAATGQGVMVLAMTASPIAIVAHHHTVADAAHAIQFHVLGMFLPSFFTGALIARFGVVRIMFAGVGLLAGHIALALSGTEVPFFISALTLLGVGWNFLFIGGTTLLTTAYTPAERGRAQAVNDLTVVTVGFLSSASSGALLAVFGWQTMNMLLLPWLGVMAAALVWFARRRTASVTA
ncbi:MAG: MFS transporter [Rhodospirillaceae bacterium]